MATYKIQNGATGIVRKRVKDPHTQTDHPTIKNYKIAKKKIKYTRNIQE